MKEEKIIGIDEIRGIACIIVLCAHSIAINPDIGIYANGCGKIGVWCFMVLSGFLSIYPYLCGIKDYREYNIKSAISYYCKKIKTLYPTYIIALIFGLCVGFIPNLESVVKHMFFLESIGHFWYMPVIIKFYAIFPLFVLLYKLINGDSKKYGFLIGLITVCLSIIFPFTKCVENSNQLRWYIPVFCLGIMLALIYYGLKDKLDDKIEFDMVCIASICGIIFFTPLLREKIWGISPSDWLQNKYILMGFLWCGIILSLLFSKIIKSVLIKSKIFAWVSVISYEIYLFHYILLFKFNSIYNDMSKKVLIMIIATFMISVITHWTLKKL